MKTIEEINQNNVKKFFQRKKSLTSFLVMLLKLASELQREKKREFNISKVFV